MNKKVIFFFSTSVCTVPKMEQYCSCVSKFIRFRTPHEKSFLVFDVPNAKYLTFGTPNDDVLSKNRKAQISYLSITT